MALSLTSAIGGLQWLRDMLNHSRTRLTLNRLISFCLLLAFCLIACAAAEKVSDHRLGGVASGAPEPGASPDSRTDNELPINDLDDDPALPILLGLAALTGLVSSLTLPSLYLFSRRWPPPLRPPQAG